MDRIDELRLFTSVAAHLSFAQAARAHRRSPQAVTRAIASLEERAGARLLQRTTRSVSLTGDGERYLELARRALAEIDRLDAHADPHAPLRGTLSVHAPVLFGQLHVVPLAAEMLGLHPDVDLRLTLLDRVVSLAEEGVDVALRLGALPDSSLRARLLGHVRSVLVASPAYLERAGTPRSPEALARHACVAFTGTTPIADRWAFPAPRRDRSVRVRPRLVVNTGQAAIDAALLGLGVARVFSYQVEELVTSGRLRLLLRAHEPPPVPAHLVHAAGITSRPALAFLDLAERRLRARLR
ncbi:MAG TPA: LysR family transcriptional regulator [Kofleriaceae bacterium]|nr:LysR family transcriptional regulator [Kofleriaceae bacterium]